MHIVEVKSDKEKRQFLDVVDKIYKNDDAYIRPFMGVKTPNTITKSRQITITD